MKNAAKGKWFGCLGTPKILAEKVRQCKKAGCKVDRDNSAATVVAYSPADKFGVPAGEPVFRALRKAPGIWLMMYHVDVWVR